MDDEFDPDDLYAMSYEAFREDWDDPRMAVYDDYESHKSQSDGVS